jgi:hypothetical protein
MTRRKPVVVTIELITKVKELLKDYMFIEIAEILNVNVVTVSRIVKKYDLKLSDKVIQRREEIKKKHHFKKGQISHNKGKKMSPEAYEKVKKSMFKPGQIPSNSKPIGYERICPVDKIIFIKVSERGPMVSKSRYIWEQNNGPIPKGKVVSFKDGNRLNCDIDNLFLTTQEEIMLRNSLHNYPELRDVNRLIKKLKKRIQDAEKQN